MQSNQSNNTFFPRGSIHPVGRCAKCGREHVQLVFNNNPIIGASTVCYDCVVSTLDLHNLNHADLFCRTYNYPFDPEAWMAIVDDPSCTSSPVFALQTYVEAALAEKENQPNLAYGSATNDLWKRTTEEWKKCRDFAAILDRIEPIRDSYIKRSGMKWGEHYTFSELLKLDSIYVRTLRANNITNPLQQEAVRTLCKLLIEMDQAIAAKDAKAIKDFSDAWAKFAKQANLETMINESRTEDIVTMSELASYLEERNFMPSFYDNNPRDEVDRTIADLQDTQRRLIMESLSLQPVWEDTVKRYERTQEDEYAGRAAEENSLEHVLNFNPEEAAKPEVESDTEVTNADFSADEASSPALEPLTIQRDPRKGGGANHNG